MSHEQSPQAYETELLHLGYGGGASAPELESTPNQDNYLNDYERQVFAVFDGVGGSKDGALASRKATEAIWKHTQGEVSLSTDERIARGVMTHAFKKAHLAVQRNTEGHTTAAALHLFRNNEGEGKALVLHTGDSRVYRLRGNRLTALTLDHNPYYTDALPVDWRIQNALAGTETLDTALKHLPKELHDTATAIRENRDIIGASMGEVGRNSPRSTPLITPVEQGDRFLLTTDGIHDNLTTRQIEAVMNSTRDPKAVSSELVAQAQWIAVSGTERAKHDDMTALVVNITNKY